MGNRHDVIIWDSKAYPVEQDYLEAVQQVVDLSRQQAPPSDELLAFAHRLDVHSDDEDLEPDVVSYLQSVTEQLVASNTAALMLSLPECETHWRSVLDVIVDVTTRLRLGLCIEELGFVFLPDGVILSLRPRTEAQPLVTESKNKKGFPVSLKQFVRLFETKVGALLNEHGFILGNEESDEGYLYVRCHKTFNKGTFLATLHYYGGRGQFGITINVRIIEDNMMAIAQKPDFNYSMSGGGGVRLNVHSMLKPNDDAFIIDCWETFEEFLGLLTTSVLRWSDAIKDIKGVDALLNGDIDEEVKKVLYGDSDFIPYALIAARLAGNPRFDELAIRLGAHGPDSRRRGWLVESNFVVSWLKLVNFLREEVSPLVYLADGSLVPPRFQLNDPQPVIDPADIKDFPSTVEQFHAVLKTKVDGLLIAHDFVLTKETTKDGHFGVAYDKAIKQGKLSLRIDYREHIISYNREISPSIVFNIIEDNMVAIAQKIGFSDIVLYEYKNGVPLLIIRANNGERALRKSPCINNWKKFEEMLDLLKESVLRWSDDIDDIKGIDALLNGSNIDTDFKYSNIGFLYAPYALIAARLAGNPNFEALALHLAPYGSGKSFIWVENDGDASVALAWPKLVSYLREFVKPLVHTHGQSDEPKPIIDSEDVRGFPVSINQLHDLSKTTISALLSEHDFFLMDNLRFEDHIYEKVINGGRIRLTLSHYGRWGDFESSIAFQIIEDSMMAIAKKSDFLYSMKWGGGVYLNVYSILQLKEKIRLNNWKTFEAFLSLLRSSVLRWSDAVVDIMSIDALLNGNIDKAVKNEVHGSCYTPFALIAARLAGNPHFDELAVSLGTYGAGSGRAWGKFSDAEVAVAWPKLVKYLKEEVKPLV